MALNSCTYLAPIWHVSLESLQILSQISLAVHSRTSGGYGWNFLVFLLLLVPPAGRGPLPASQLAKIL
jgi:hypothetical protein